MDQASILREASRVERDTRKTARVARNGWQIPELGPGIKLQQVRDMVGEGLLEVVADYPGYKTYHLTEGGRNVVAFAEGPQPPVGIPAATVMEAMQLVVGYEDVKEEIAFSVEQRNHLHWMFEGPPASAKSVFLEAIRSAVPDAFMVFGIRTTAAGLSQELFSLRPPVLLLDEIDKCKNEVWNLLLGLLETGEILDTKYGGSRGIRFDVQAFGACNDPSGMSDSFLSRFTQLRFPAYTRDEFAQVSRALLSTRYGAGEEIAEKLGLLIYDNGLGDIRAVMRAWSQMHEPSEAEVRRVVQFLLRWAPGGHVPGKGRRRATAVQAGLGL